MDVSYDFETEDVVLGTVIRYPGEFDKVCRWLNNSEVFGQERAKILWKKIKRMKKSAEHIDTITVCSNINKEDAKKGLTKHYVVTCTGQASVAGTTELYASKIYEKYLMRNVIKNSQLIAEKAKGNMPDVYELLGEAHTLYGKLLDVRPTVAANIESVIKETLDSINNQTNKLIKTGYGGMDKFAGGLTRGEITIIGGRPGHGKTTIMINMLSKMLEQGYRVMFFSRELPNTELLKKIVCLESEQLSYNMVRKNIYNETDLKLVNQTLDRIKDKYGEDKFLMFDNIRDFATSSAEVRKFKPDIIFDDYIQLISCNGKEEHRRLQLEKLCNDYKWLAKETDAVVVLASQLNRAIEYRDDSKPQLSDLAESGAIEQVAENVFFVYYEYKVKGESGKDKDLITLFARKIRYGETGDVDLGYAGDRCKLYNSREEITNDEIPF